MILCWNTYVITSNIMWLITGKYSLGLHVTNLCFFLWTILSATLKMGLLMSQSTCIPYCGGNYYNILQLETVFKLTQSSSHLGKVFSVCLTKANALQTV